MLYRSFAGMDPPDRIPEQCILWCKTQHIHKQYLRDVNLLCSFVRNDAESIQKVSCYCLTAYHY